MINKVNTCSCFFTKKGFYKGEDYFYEKLDKGTMKVWYMYRHSISDYELLSIKQFNNQFKRMNHDKD